MDALPSLALAGAALVTGLVQVVKTATNLDSRYASLVALALGVLLGLGYATEESVSLFNGLVAGLGTGLSASGLYSGQKALRDSGPVAESGS